MRMRRDISEVNEASQTLYFSKWMGGPTLSAIKDCICTDGKRRLVEITGEPDTMFTVPARTKANGKTVGGYVTVDDGVYKFFSSGRNRDVIARQVK